MLKKEQLPKSNFSFVDNNLFLKKQALTANQQQNETSLKNQDLPGRRRQTLHTFNTQQNNYIEFKSGLQNPLDSSQPAELQIRNRNNPLISRKNNSLQANFDTPDKRATSFMNTTHNKIKLYNKSRDYVSQNKDLQGTLTQFESLIDIGNKLRPQYFGMATTPISGRAEASKNSVRSRYRKKSIKTDAQFTQQIQFQNNNGLHLEILPQEEQNSKRQPQSPNISQISQQSTQFPPSSHFFYQSIKEFQTQSPSNNSYIPSPFSPKISKQVDTYLTQEETQQMGENFQKQKQGIEQFDRAKQNWGISIQEQKKMFISLSSPHQEYIKFENKRDEDNFYKKNKSLYNKNFLGKQQAINNKTCLKSLLKNNNHSKEIPFDAKVYEKYQDFYRRNKLHSIVQSSQPGSFTTMTANNLQQDQTSKLFGGAFFQELTQNSPSYSQEFLNNNMVNNKSPHSSDTLQQNITTGHETPQILSQDLNQNVSKWKYKMNIESENIKDVSSSTRLPLKNRVSIYKATKPFKQSHISIDIMNRHSNSLHQFQGDVTRKSSQSNMPSIEQIYSDTELNQTRLRGSSQPFISNNKSQHRSSSHQYLSIPSIKSQAQIGINKDEPETNKNTESNQVKFTRISEEDDGLDNNFKGNIFTFSKQDQITKLRPKSDYESSLQRSISKQIGVDLQQCMPKKVKKSKIFYSQTRNNQLFFTSKDVQCCFDNLRLFFTTKFQQDFSYKLIMNQTELSADQFINKFQLFLSHCITTGNATKIWPSTPQSLHQTKYNNFSQQLMHLTSSPQSTNSVIRNETERQQQFLTPRYKVGPSNGFRLQKIEYNTGQRHQNGESTNGFRPTKSSQQKSIDVFSGLKIAHKYQNQIVEDTITIIKQIISDSSQIAILSSTMKQKMQTLLTPKHIIQEIGGKLNTKRLFSQVFQHMEDRYGINTSRIYCNSVSKLDNNSGIPQAVSLSKNREDIALDQILLLLNNETLDMEINTLHFSAFDFFYFKLSLQCVCERQGLTQKQTYKLMQKIESNRHLMCNSLNLNTIIDNFAQKRQLALLLLENTEITENYLTLQYKTLSNSFIFLDNILDFIENKIKTYAFAAMINKKFKEFSINKGILQNIFKFAKIHIFPIILNQDELSISYHPLVLQFQQKLEFIEHENYSINNPSQIWKFEDRQQKWNQIYSKLQNISSKSTIVSFNQNEDTLKKRQYSLNDPTKISITLINATQDEQLKDKLYARIDVNQEEMYPFNENNNYENKIAQKTNNSNEDIVTTKATTTQPFIIKELQKQHTCLNSNESLIFLKYIFDFSMCFYDIYSAFDMEVLRFQFKINQYTFDQWMNTTQPYLQQLNYTEDETNHLIFYLKKYSLLYN